MVWEREAFIDALRRVCVCVCGMEGWGGGIGSALRREAAH